MRTHENVLILTTSNLTDAIDTAFIDRADVKQYIGPPNHPARFTILAGALEELMRVGIITPACRVPSFDECAAAAATAETASMPNLWTVAAACV